MIKELYPRYLDCGYSPFWFERLSPAEITELLNSHSRRQELERERYRNRLQDAIRILDGMVFALTSNLAAIMPGSTSRDYYSIEKHFPELFREERNPDTGEYKWQPADLELYKAQRMHQAYLLNRNRKEGR